MPINIQIPTNEDPIDYLASFAPVFSGNVGMHNALLGVQDSLRQAMLVPLEPLGMLACLTAEEEAATFLYYALREKGYPVPEYGKLHRHADKTKLVVFSHAIYKYFFEKFFVSSAFIRIERIGDQPRTTFHLSFGDYEIVQDDPLQIIRTEGEGEDGHAYVVEKTIDELLAEIVPKGFSIKYFLKHLANRRNLCLYGDPKSKKRLQSEQGISHFKFNCVAMLVFGILVSNGDGRTSSMNKLVEAIYRKLST